MQKVETLQGSTATWDYTYDPAGRLDTVTRTPSGGSAVLVADHAYDANGNRLCTNETAGSCPVSALYDEQDRLVTDEAGRSYFYTEAGDLARVSEGSTHTLYRYDALGALREVCLGSSDPGSCTGGTEIEYAIDPLGRRIGKRVNAALQKGYLWSDGLRVVAELDGSGAVVSRFVYGTRVNVPEYMVKGGVTYRILADHLGSVRLVVDAATGAVAQRIDYDVWGNATFTGPADFQPFGFAGGLYDADTGLVRFGARDYDARTGRWTSKDPIRFRGNDANVFAYAASDPINLHDPNGRAVIVNVSGKPTRTSRNRPGGGQDIFFVPGVGTSGFADADTIIADDGSVLKVPTDSVVFIFDPCATESFGPGTNIPGLPRGRFVPDPQGEFGPFFDPGGTRVGNPGPLNPGGPNPRAR